MVPSNGVGSEGGWGLAAPREISQCNFLFLPGLLKGCGRAVGEDHQLQIVAGRALTRL